MSKFNIYSIIRDVRLKVTLIVLIGIAFFFLFVTNKTIDSYSENFNFYEETYRNDLEYSKKTNGVDSTEYKNVQGYYSRAKEKNDFYKNNQWQEAFQIEIEDNLVTLESLKDEDSMIYDGVGNRIMEVEIDNALYSYFISKNVQPIPQDSNNSALVNTFRFLSIIVPIVLLIFIPLILVHQYSLDYNDRLYIKRLEPFGLGRIIGSKLAVTTCFSLAMLFIPIFIVFMGSLFLHGYGEANFPIVLQTLESYELLPIGTLLSKALILTGLVTIFVTLVNYLLFYSIRMASISMAVFVLIAGGSVFLPNRFEMVNRYIHLNIFSHLLPVNIVSNAFTVNYQNSHFNFGYSALIISVGIMLCATISFVLMLKDKKC